jgi:putative tryptophan/tyrosine transport system substrate-binding protein
MINRRRLIGALASGALAEPFVAGAQADKQIWKIGYIGSAPIGTSPESERLVGAFVQALRESGFVEGKNIVFERRSAEGRADRAAAQAAELVGLHVDVIVVLFTSAALAAKAATTTIPIVMSGASDPVGSGLVASLARPGGNVTGLSDFTEDLYPKQLELLSAVVPRLVRVAFVREDAANPTADTAAQALALDVRRIVMKTPQEFEKVTATIMRERVDTLLLQGSPAYVMRKEFAEFAIRRRLPTMVGGRPVVSGGALMSLGADYLDIFRKVASYVAKILNGANPADLPVEQPTKVEFIINLKTAKAIGLTIPQSMLLRADELIQ